MPPAPQQHDLQHPQPQEEEQGQQEQQQQAYLTEAEQCKYQQQMMHPAPGTRNYGFSDDFMMNRFKVCRVCRWASGCVHVCLFWCVLGGRGVLLS